MSTAVVTIAHGRRAHLANQHRSLGAGTVAPDHYVVVAMDDPLLLHWRPEGAPVPHTSGIPSTPLGLPLAAARNAGVARALDLGADTIVCLDVDCLAGHTLVEAYTAAVASRPDVVWSGPVTYLPPPPPSGYDLKALDALDDPHPARPALRPGEQRLVQPRTCSGRCRSRCTGMPGRRPAGSARPTWGTAARTPTSDTVIVASGLELGWTGSARAYHQHHESHDPPLGHVDDILRNGRIFHDRWGYWPMTGWLEEFERRGIVRRRNGHWERADLPS